jgi:hypothetical protein
MPAKIMLGYAGVEFVGGQLVLTLQHLEIRSGHDQVLKSDHVADTAIAFAQAQIRRCLDFKSHPPAMATAAMCGHVQFSRYLHYFLNHVTSILFAGIA